MAKPTTEVKTASLLSYVAAAIIVLLPFHAFFTTWLGSNFGHLDLIRIWKEIIIFAMALVCVWLAFANKKLLGWIQRAALPQMITLYFLLNFAMGIWAIKHNQVNATALVYALLINLRFLGFFLVCYVLATYSDFLKKHWQKLLLWPAAIVLAFGLLQLLLPTDFLKHFGYGPGTIPAYQTVDSDINYQRIQSFLRGANPLGAYLVLIIPAIAFTVAGIWRLIGLAAGFVVLIYTYSRSAWIGVGSAVGSLAAWKYEPSRKAKEISLIALAIVVLVGLGFYAFRSNQTFQDALFHTSSKSTNVSSNAQRTSAIKSALQDVYRDPMGKGPGTAGPASFRNNGHTARIAENYYLQLGQEIGIIGIFLFILINLLAGKELWLRRNDKLAQVLLASLIGISFVALVSHAWTDDTLSLLWWGLAAVAIAPKVRRNTE